MYFLIMVLDDPTELSNVLEAWANAGVRGVTILESTGINRVLTRANPHPAMMRFGSVFGTQRVGHNTLFAVIDSLETAERAVAGTEAELGDLSKPDTGIITVLPVIKTWGLSKEYTAASSEEETQG